MKAIIVSLLLFFTVSAQTIWYIDRDATGAGDGTSWTDAWTSFDTYWTGNPDGADWTQVQGGDSVYVSGGSDSTVYRGTTYIRRPSPGITYSSEVVIAPSWESGHNGDVYIMNSDTTVKVNFNIKYVSNIKLVGFTFWTNCVGDWSFITGGTAGGAVNVLVQDDSLVTFDNCVFINDSTGNCLAFSTDASRSTLSNSILRNSVNYWAKDQDLLTYGASDGGHTLSGNSIYAQCQLVDGTSHRDFIQISAGVAPLGDDRMLEFKFINNFFYANTPNSVNWNHGIYVDVTDYVKQRFTFINNIIMFNPDHVNTAFFRLGGAGLEANSNVSYRLYNNTFIAPDVAWFRYCDTIIAKNNIFIGTEFRSDGAALVIGNSDAGFDAAYKDLDYNHYYYKSWDSDDRPFTNGNQTAGHEYNWGEWQGLGLDTHSDTGYISLVDVVDSVISAYMPSGSLIDAGVNLFPLFSTDIRNEPRSSSGPWDLGAIELDGAPSNSINVKSKIFLQGPFNSNSMSTTLNQGGFLPNSQPFNSDPWYYNGTENLGSGPNSTMVDWVLVELRNAPNDSAFARRAALLKNNGLLLETNGLEGVNFNNIDPGFYYIVVYHRNHLAIMSAGPVQLSSNSTLYDFTTAMNKAYGQNSMVQLASGKYGMYASDGNADGIINLTDRDSVWLMENGNMDYLGGDFNMNSGVTVHDVNQFWNVNIGRKAWYRQP